MTGYITIAGSAVEITRLGFGCARILGGSEARASARLIETALECGIRHFDTAPSYGNGGSEQLLGEILAGVSGVTVTTKVGGAPSAPAVASGAPQRIYRRFVRPALAVMPGVKSALRRAIPGPPPVAAPRRPLDSDMVMRGLDESERRLRRRVDIYLLHEPERLDLAAGLADRFAALQVEGRIGAFGQGVGGSGDNLGAFGTVRQCCFGSAQPGTGVTAIYHGALRTGGAARDTAAARIAAALAESPDAAIIFSASTPGQIRSALRGVG